MRLASMVPVKVASRSSAVVDATMALPAMRPDAAAATRRPAATPVMSLSRSCSAVPPFTSRPTPTLVIVLNRTLRSCTPLAMLRPACRRLEVSWAPCPALTSTAPLTMLPVTPTPLPLMDSVESSVRFCSVTFAPLMFTAPVTWLPGAP